MRIYTLAEARALLPEVAPVVGAIQRAYRALRALQASVASDNRRTGADGNLIADPWQEGESDGLETLAAAVREGAATLEGWGIELKDPDKGLIDFYWRQDGEIAYLCWFAGEPSLTYWHRLHDGFAGRRRIAER